MKLLTSLGHQLDGDDFCFVPEGEVLYDGIVVCCNSHSCGCNRSFAGSETHKATTLAVVTDVDMDDHDLFDLAAKTGRKAGWGGDLILASLRSIRTGIDDLPVGTVVRPRFDFDTEDWTYDIVKESVTA